MNSARKLTALSAAVLSASLLTACSSSKSSDSSNSSSSGASTSAGGTLGKIVYIPGLTGNPFYSTVNCGAGNEAKAKGVAYGYQGASTFDVAKQTSVVEAVANTKPGAIMISIDDPKAMATPLKEAKAKGIKIITIDGDLSDTSIGISNIESDALAGGKLAGVAVGKALGSQKGTILELDNNNAFVPSQQRTTGFADGVKSMDPNVTVLPVQYTTGDIGKATSIVQAAISAHPDMLAVFGAETANTQGAFTAVDQKGKDGKILVTGYDTSDPIITALKAGKIFGTVVQNPRGEGKLGVDTAIAAMQGQSVPKNQPADALFVTKDTVDTAQAQAYIYDVNCKIQ
jgi:ribose transport system substrate-binding protein